ncbi:cation:proton antiporter [Aquabacterium sp. A7-Y]|uniref:cation:proton antiporter n=1 Tax=Aquabacterium sp. A7-Y TaxID=1349605 RepID=UPI00223E7D25|nr:cation:proton antiporter [Aquabacterium sp. A7-Y]MCW7536902.1 cation:proton antiporter [Aquabacterium sp. A7-Y]
MLESAKQVGTAAAGAAQSAVGSQAEHLVLQLLYQLIVILVLTRVVSWASKRYLGQTDVAGEILAGLVLGPSLLGALFPNVFAALFVPQTSTIFVGLAQTGLILLMFQIGLEFEFKSNLSAARHTVVVISIAGIVCPFLLGYLTAPWFWEQMSGQRPDLLAFRLFFATAMSITAIPILGRIFMELGLSHTRTAALTIGSAAIDDILGWLLLGVVSAIVTSSFQPGNFAWRLGGLAAYIALVFLVLRPLIHKSLNRHTDKNGVLNPVALPLLLVLLFVSAAVTSNLGVFAIIGGFVIGVALHDNRQFVQQWKDKMGGLVNALFLPIFFAYTGLRTDVGSLGDSNAWLQCLLVCAVAFAGKFGGAYLAARALGESHRSSMAIGVCMNTRALMELIALNIGYDMGVLPRQMFTMLVIMAIVSTFIATPLIRWLMRSESRLTAPQPAEAGLAERPQPAAGV